MSERLHVFVSSVQKELEDERVIVQNLLNTDTFLSAHCSPVLYEFEPASPNKALDGCLKSLADCQVYLLIVAAQYGTVVGRLSINHAEYRRAKAMKLPVLAFIKGDRKAKREEGTEAFLKELDHDGPKYKRFGNVADAYRGTEPDGNPGDHEDLRGPMPAAIDRAIAFIDRNTRHPMRIVGLNRVRLDEYPVEALREALVNAVAHRQYEDAGRKIILEIFADRVVISSPGFPPSPITLASLRKGKYRPCSRNPVLAQCLSYFHRLEERGSGFRRMRDQMLNHGLDQPLLGTDTGYFQVTFPGPGDNLDRLRMPETRLMVTPALEARLNQRQRDMVRRLISGEELTSRQCRQLYALSAQAVYDDFQKLMGLGIARRTGSGRATRYVLHPQS